MMVTSDREPRADLADEDEGDERSRTDSLFFVALLALAASHVVLGSIAIRFDNHLPRLSEAVARSWHVDIPSDAVNTSGDYWLVIGLITANVLAVSLIYSMVRDNGDVMNLSGVDVVRRARGRRVDRPPVDGRTFVLSIVIGGWVGAIGVALYGLFTRDLEAIVYGPAPGLLFGSLLLPGVVNAVLVLFRRR